MFYQKVNITGSERAVFRIHLSFSIIQGIIAGVFALNEFVFIKDLKGTDFQLSILLQLAVLVMLVGVVANEFIKRIQNQRKMLLNAAFLTHTPLFILLFFPHDPQAYIGGYYHYIFLGVFFFYFLNSIIVLPAINRILKEAYSHENFGKLYSYSSQINKVIILIVTLSFGLLLDIHNFIFIYVYPVMAVLGIYSVLILSRIDQQISDVVSEKTTIIAGIKNSYKEIFNTLRGNRPYLHFEIGFMLYGFAWMITAALITLYFNDVLKMNHATFGFYKNGYNILAIILLPYFGRLLGNIDPREFGTITFGAFALFLTFVALTQYLPASFEFAGITFYYSLIVAYIFYGVFAATMALLWFIGSAYFCKKEEAAHYQSIHLTLTGVRGIFAFQLGIVFFHIFGYSVTFAISLAFLIGAMTLMRWSYKRNQLGIEHD